MRNNKRSLAVLELILFCLIPLSTQLFPFPENKKNFPVLKGPYLGQKPPGLIPEMFAPGIVSTGFTEQFAYFTPDGRELYWLLRGAPHTVILFMKEVNGRWTKPKVAPFSGKYFAKFCLGPEGNRIVLTSTQPRSGSGEPTDVLTTWFVDRMKGGGWGEQKLIPIFKDAAAPSISAKGNLYFFLDIGNERDIYVSEYKQNRYSKPIKLGNAINSRDHAVDPYIAPDESYLIYGASGPDGDGLYISFRGRDGAWIKAINMSNRTEIPADANCPSVTVDGKYLFFTSLKIITKSYSEKPITYEEKLKILKSPGNGSSDIYWVDARILEGFRPK
jgi:hypothetical protein